MAEKRDTQEGSICLGPVEKIPLGQGLCFVVGRREIAIFRLRSGKLHALYNRCPHRQGSLAEGIADECQVICPYHGHKFDLKTGEGSEERECVQVYPVWEENGDIYFKLK